MENSTSCGDIPRNLPQSTRCGGLGAPSEQSEMGLLGKARTILPFGPNRRNERPSNFVSAEVGAEKRARSVAEWTASATTAKKSSTRRFVQGARGRVFLDESTFDLAAAWTRDNRGGCVAAFRHEILGAGNMMVGARTTFDGRPARRFVDPPAAETGKTVVVKIVASESGQLAPRIRVPIPCARPLKTVKEAAPKRLYVSGNNWIRRVVKADEKKQRRFFFKTTPVEIVNAPSTSVYGLLMEERLGRRTLLGGGPKEDKKKGGRPKKRQSNNPKGKKKSSPQQDLNESSGLDAVVSSDGESSKSSTTRTPQCRLKKASKNESGRPVASSGSDADSTTSSATFRTARRVPKAQMTSVAAGSSTLSKFLRPATPPSTSAPTRRSVRVAALAQRVLIKRLFALKNLTPLTPVCHKRTHPAACASATVNHAVPYYNSGEFSEQCEDCGALLLRGEKNQPNKYSKCCRKGKCNTAEMVKVFNELQDPPNLLHLLTEPNTGARAKHYLRMPIRYNSQCQMGSLRTFSEKLPPGGPKVCKFNGEFHYEFSDIDIPNGFAPKFAQLYTIDHDTAVQIRSGTSAGSACRRDVLCDLVAMITLENEFAKSYKMAADILKSCSEDELFNFRLTLLDRREISAQELQRQGIHPHRVENVTGGHDTVAVVWKSADGEAPKFSGLWLHGKSGKLEVKNAQDSILDPIMFPILFPKGTLGFQRGLLYNDYVAQQQQGSDDFYEADEEDDNVIANAAQTKRAHITHREYARYLMHCRGGNYHWLWSHRALAELYVIHVVNRIERSEADYIKQNVQKDLRSALPAELLDALNRGIPKQSTANGKTPTVGKVYMVPSTWKGGRRYMQIAYADAMAIARKFGNPTWFLTFTGNPNWPEVKAALNNGETVANRPDIVCRIFMDKAKELLKDLTERHVLGKVVAHMHSVEHQKRGIPHMHILLILEKDDRLSTPEFVDEFISAEIPNLPMDDDHSEAAEQQRRLHQIITTNNIHDCNQHCLVDGVCAKRFPKEFSPNTVLDPGKKKYARRAPKIEEPLGRQDACPDNDDENDVNYQRRQFVPESGIPDTDDVNKYGNVVQKEKNKIVTEYDNSRVVPYNAYLSLKYSCHINLEYVFDEKCCRYVFKYLMKGCDMAYVRVQKATRKKKADDDDECGDDDDLATLKPKDAYDEDEDAEYVYDEFDHTFCARYMTSQEAIMRLFTYPVVHLSHPVTLLSVHGPEGEAVIFREGYEADALDALADTKKSKKSMLEAFFDLCKTNNLASDLLYEEVIDDFVFVKSKDRHRWKPRERKADSVPRMYTISVKNQELFAIRLLLQVVRGPTCFEELRTFNGITYDTFTEAAVARQLIEDNALWRKTLLDASVEMPRRRFIRFFGSILMNCNPSDKRALFNDDEIFGFLGDRKFGNRAAQEEDVLQRLEYFFLFNNSSCKEQQLPSPKNFDASKFEQQEKEEELRYNIGDDADTAPRGMDAKWKKIADDKINAFNNDQRSAFEKVMNAMEKDDGQKIFFLSGDGGTGKSYFYNALIAACHANGDVVIPCASTGIASILLMSTAGTAHRTFRLPIDIPKEFKCQFSSSEYMGQQLREAKLIIIDEVSMLHRDVIQAIDTTLRFLFSVDAKERNTPFAGKVVIFGGDWKQILPVVPGESLQAQAAASIKFTPYYDMMTQLRLEINMRVKEGEHDFAMFIKAVGNGLIGQQKSGGTFPLPKSLIAADLAELIEFCFGVSALQTPLDSSDAFSQNAILCPTNDGVNAINQQILENMPGKVSAKISMDKVLKRSALDDLSVHAADFCMENIHRQTPSGMPPHILHLKVGTIVMLIKNMDVKDGLCNGTRLQILAVEENLLKCRILTGPRANRRNKDGKVESVIFLPRVRFEYGGSKQQQGVEWERVQFPVRVSFAMTINKSQGQTLQRVGLYLKDRDVFSHGHFYTALSRVTCAEGIKIVCNSGRNENTTIVRNIVYEPILDAAEKQHAPMMSFLDEYAKISPEIRRKGAVNYACHRRGVLPQGQGDAQPERSWYRGIAGKRKSMDASQTPATKQRRSLNTSAPITAENAVCVSAETMATLDDGRYLDHDIIDRYFIYCRNKIRDETRRKRIAIMPVCYEAALGHPLQYWNALEDNPRAVTRLLMPIFVHGNHFVLAICDEAMTTIYDSLNNLRITNVPADLEAHIRNILRGCYGYETTPICMRPADEFDRQHDGFNCGVFVCHYGEQILRRGYISSTPNFDINAKRAELRQLFSVRDNHMTSSPTDDEVLKALEVDAEMRDDNREDEEMDAQTEEEELADYLEVACRASQSPSAPGPSKRRQRTPVPAEHSQRYYYVPERILQSLDAGRWLNSDVINTYILDCICRHGKESSVAFLSTFYEARRKNNATRHWSLRDKSADGVTTLIMPRFVDNNHFILAVYHQGDTVVYDSLHLHTNVPDELQRQLSSILTDCFGDRSYAVRLATRDEFNEQRDGYNCGVMVCHYAEQFIRHSTIRRDPAFDVDFKRLQIRQLFRLEEPRQIADDDSD